jgi:hypothetical protein
LNIKLKGRHFDRTEVMETLSQAVLNSLTELDFQDAFNKWQSAGTTSRVTVARKQKVSF